MPTPNANSKQHIVRILLATTLAVSTLFVLLIAAHSGAKVNADAAGDQSVYLPAVYGGPQPAGSYFCYEYEFGLIWSTDVITLNSDGSGVYDTYYGGIRPGTWVYTPATQEVGFTNFTWQTATFYAPDRLWNSKYLTYAGFEIAIDCGRR